MYFEGAIAKFTAFASSSQSQQSVTATYPQSPVAPRDSRSNRYSGNLPATYWHRNIALAIPFGEYRTANCE